MSNPRITTTASLLIALVTATLLAGCGRKGPLYLPEPQQEQTDKQQEQQEPRGKQKE